MAEPRDFTPMAILLLVIVLWTWLAGCRSSQNTTQQVARDYTSQLDGLSTRLDSLQAGLQASRKQVTDKLSNLKVEHTTTYYTLPDSAGRQYPVYVSTTKADQNEETTQRVYTELNATLQRVTQQVDSLARMVDKVLRQEQKIAEVSWWDRHKMHVVGIAFGILAIVLGCTLYKLCKA